MFDIRVALTTFHVRFCSVKTLQLEAVIGIEPPRLLPLALAIELASQHIGEMIENGFMSWSSNSFR